MKSILSCQKVRHQIFVLIGILVLVSGAYGSTGVKSKIQLKKQYDWEIEKLIESGSFSRPLENHRFWKVKNFSAFKRLVKAGVPEEQALAHMVSPLSTDFSHIESSGYRDFAQEGQRKDLATSKERGHRIYVLGSDQPWKTVKEWEKVMMDRPTAKERPTPVQTSIKSAKEYIRAMESRFRGAGWVITNRQFNAVGDFPAFKRLIDLGVPEELALRYMAIDLKDNVAGFKDREIREIRDAANGAALEKAKREGLWFYSKEMEKTPWMTPDQWKKMTRKGEGLEGLYSYRLRKPEEFIDELRAVEQAAIENRQAWEENIKRWIQENR